MEGTPSLWAATAAPGPTLAPLAGELHAQVTIIGAGYTGLCAAIHLCAAGRDVVVLEALDIGAGASGLNGGQVIPGVKHDPDELERLWGPKLGAAMVATVASGPDLVFELIGRFGIACDAVRTGWIQPATSGAALEAITARVQQWRRRGADVALLTARETARLIGSERYSGGWIDRRGGTVQPLSYVRGLARAARLLGSRVFTGSPALSLERDGAEWRVRTRAGSVRSATVILATGAYTGPLVDPLRRTIIPVPSFQVATRPIPQSLRRTLLPQGQAASDTWHLLRYFRLDASGRLLMGSRGSFAQVPLQAAARHHYRAVREIFPQLAGIGYEYHWGGLVDMTRDHLPHLHELAPGLLAGLGYNGRGVAMATLMGRLLARWTLGEPVAQLGFPVSAVTPISLHRFNRLGAQLAIQCLRALDGLVRMRDRMRRRGAAGRSA
ncbi:MAG TPA: FAD-dependent oxidoreductase [Steroidobacteraceae bacterium]